MINYTNKFIFIYLFYNCSCINFYYLDYINFFFLCNILFFCWHLTNLYNNNNYKPFYECKIVNWKFYCCCSLYSRFLTIWTCNNQIIVLVVINLSYGLNSQFRTKQIIKNVKKIDFFPSICIQISSGRVTYIRLLTRFCSVFILIFHLHSYERWKVNLC